MKCKAEKDLVYVYVLFFPHSSLKQSWKKIQKKMRSMIQIVKNWFGYVIFYPYCYSVIAELILTVVTEQILHLPLP